MMDINKNIIKWNVKEKIDLAEQINRKNKNWKYPNLNTFDLWFKSYIIRKPSLTAANNNNKKAITKKSHF